MYEIPKGLYTGERILKILLNPNIKRRRVCHKRPINVSVSSTFVVDLNSLEHPDDIKRMSSESGSTVGRILFLTWPGILARGCSLSDFIHVLLNLRMCSSFVEFIASTPLIHSKQAQMVLSCSGYRPHLVLPSGDINATLSVLISSHLPFVHT